ncbi:MAG: TatD family hydrolase [Candidatus Aminicenantes bacterium]|nr:MAG: TatD family hydrolase [Candidatus Aminicenantes bacterium]
MKFVDSHAHINSEEFQNDRDQVIARASQEDIQAILCPVELTEPKNLQTALDLIEKHENIFAAAGVHPHNAKDFHAGVASILKQWASEKKICAVGEIGLDFHYNFSSPQEQGRVFRNQLNLAQDLDLPVVIHSRNAADEIAVAIEKEGFSNGGVLHCFTENWEFGEHMLEHDFLISFSGILTYPNAQSLRDVAAKLPLDKILIETDSPYLVPVPYRGKIKRNEPLYVKEVAKTLAIIKKLDLGEIARMTSQNFSALFPFEI